MNDMKEVKLMVGNLVTVNNPEYHPKLKGVVLRVTSISPNGDEYSIGLEHINQKPNTYYETYSQFLRFVEPIPLTEGWLIKGGLKDGIAIHNYNFSGFIRIRHIGDLWLFCIGLLELVYFEYVHQIQNLFFALTGEELEFNC